jgi:hypothetical protein
MPRPLRAATVAASWPSEADEQGRARVSIPRVRCALILPLCALALSCDHPNLPNDQIWASPHFRYATRADDPGVCAGVMDRLEAHLQALGDYFGVAWAGGTIDYYKFRDRDDFRANSDCPQSASACATPVGDVRSTRPLDGHELVHIYTRPLGRPPLLLEEGIAEALSPEGRAFMAPEQSWRDILAVGPDSPSANLNYTAGAWFVSYLLQQFGPSAFLSFYRAAAPNHAEEAIAEQFRNVYSLDLDQLWSEAQSSAPTVSGVPVWECASAEPVQTGGAAASLAEGCDGTGAFAGLELSRPTTLTWSNDKLLRFSISSCSAAGGLYTPIPGPGEVPGAVALPAGKHYVATDLVPGTIGFGEAPGALSPDCHSLTPVVLPSSETDRLIFSITNSDVPWFAMPRIAQGGSFRVRQVPYTLNPPLTMAATIEVCDNCQGPCRVIDIGEQLQVSNGTILRFTNLVAPEGATAAWLAYR